MWLLTGPFDGNPGDISSQKSKLLKVNCTYPLGRKGKPLVVSNKKVSHDHCEFTVGDFSQEDVANPSSRPSLSVLNQKGKVIKVSRGDSEIALNPSTTLQLRDGDVLAIITGLHITVQWLPLCCYLPPDTGLKVSLDICTALAMHLITVQHPSVTHHLTPSFSSDISIITSLVSACTFIKPDWLCELLKLGTSDSGTSELEDDFSLPLTNKFRPSFASTLHPKHKSPKVWDPNEARLNLLQDFKFIILGEKPSLAQAGMKDLILRGGGSVDFFDIHDGEAKWHRALTRGQAKEGKKLVVLGDQSLLKIVVGSATCSTFFIEAESCGIKSFANLIDSILDVDTSLLTSSSPSSNLNPHDPSCVAESSATEEAEHSQRVTRAKSRQPSQERSEIPQQEEKPRKILTRRVRVNSEVDPPLKLQVITDPVVETAILAPKRALKRRAHVLSEDPKAPSQLVVPSINDSEPSNKRFKALYDSLESGADSGIITHTQISGSQTQSQSEAHGSAPKNKVILDVLREEEEETQTIRDHLYENSAKRKAEVWQDSDEEAGRPAKVMRKDTDPDSIPNIHPEPSAGNRLRKPGAAAGNPDTDAAFLRAIASTKRGKRSEDNFDREFNQLKISKPDLDREEPESEWAVLAEFGDDAHVRGNFMVVMEMDILRGKTLAQHAPSPNWLSKANFKKFHRKGGYLRSETVELVLSQSSDAFTLERNGAQSQQEPFLPKEKTFAAPRSKVADRTKARAPKNPLFLDSDAEEDETLPDTEKAEFLADQAKPYTKDINRRAMPTLADDGSDDEIVFKARAGSRRKLR